MFWMPQIPFASEFECERPNDLWLNSTVQKCTFLLKTAKWQFGQTFQNKIFFIFLSVNGWMVIWMTCVQPNCHLFVHTQTQTETETEGYRMHVVLIDSREFISVQWLHIYTVITQIMSKRHFCKPNFSKPRTNSERNIPLLWDVLWGSHTVSFQVQ